MRFQFPNLRNHKCGDFFSKFNLLLVLIDDKARDWISYHMHRSLIPLLLHLWLAIRNIDRLYRICHFPSIGMKDETNQTLNFYVLVSAIRLVYMRSRCRYKKWQLAFTLNKFEIWNCVRHVIDLELELSIKHLLLHTFTLINVFYSFAFVSPLPFRFHVFYVHRTWVCFVNFSRKGARSPPLAKSFRKKSTKRTHKKIATNIHQV